MAARTRGERRTVRLGLLGLGVAVVDLALVHAGFLTAFALRFGGAIPETNFRAYLHAAPGLSLLALLLFVVYGLYDLRPQSWRTAAAGLVAALVLLAGLGMALSFGVRAFALPRTVFVLAWISQLFYLLVWRNVAWKVARRLWGTERVVVAGSAEEATIHAARVAAGSGCLVSTAAVDSLPALLASETDQPDVLVLTPSLPVEEKARLVVEAALAGVRVLIIPSHHDLLVLDSRMAPLDDTLAFEAGPGGIPPGAVWAKRLFDLGLSAAGLIAGLPLYPFIALAVRLSSPGPVFYSQLRVGQGGRLYRLWKFRTMGRDAEAATGPVLSERDDPRVTGVGKVLRRYRLDELPQLWNVLFGAMSLVGPRPERPEFVRDFARTVPYYEYRHLIKPGITGLAQLTARYDTPAEEKLRHDLLYAKRYSLLLDLKILFLTAKVALRGEDAQWRPSG